ncbi:MAG: geranylgeranyl reductase family protein [Candidatus Hadarchaeum sp.]|uniref:geranylgeranyl reductase family protein n=1 Tax=Candidatus Hadarchaeum sp. TaxID=2883567 RepID=UPI003D0C387C
METDVVIVGAGPAGCFAGKILAEHGLRVKIVEEHAEVGRPACCAGIVGLEGIRELGIKPGKWILGRLRGVRIYPPSNEPVELTRGKVEAAVINRANFDLSLAEAAIKAGAELYLNTKCLGVNFDGGPVVKTDRGGKLKASVVMGADGPLSAVARSLGLLVKNSYIKCAQVETVADLDDDVAEVFLDKNFAPGFFGWLVKAGDVARLGLGTTTGNPVRLLKTFLYKHPVISRRVGKMLTHQCAKVIPECMSRRIQEKTVILVGDAAGQVKPLTGGGIYIGLSCAKIAAETVIKAFDQGSFDELDNYPRAVMRKFGTEFTIGARVKKVFDRMSNEDLDLLSAFLDQSEAREILLKNFDFDHHEKLITALISKAPEILRTFGVKKALRYLKLLT